MADLDTDQASAELVERMRLIARLKLDNVKKVLRLTDAQAQHLAEGEEC